MCDLHGTEAVATRPLQASDVVDELVVALSNARIYRPDHPRVTTAVDALVQGLAGWFAAHEGERFELGTTDGFLFHAHRPLLGATLSAARLVDPLERMGCGGISLGRGVDSADVLALVRVLGARRLEARTPAEANAALQQAGARHASCLPPYRGGSLGSPGSDASVSAPALEEIEATLTQVLDVTPRQDYQRTVEVLQETAVGAARGEELDLDPMRGAVERLQRQIQGDPATMLGLARYERYDEFTFGHSIRVSMLALQLAAMLTNDVRIQQRVGLAALVHDIGKARVPFELLHARRRLDAAERTEVARHTERGAEILLEMHAADPLAVAVALGHHRSLDDRSYPRMAANVELSLCTRLIKVCDVYEALTAVRPYKERMAPLRAYRIMMGMQGHFDRALLRRFIELNGIYPVGQRVRLTSGEVARVRRQTEDVLRPVVAIEVTDTGTAVRPGRRVERDLAQGNGGEGWEVTDLLAEDDAAA